MINELNKEIKIRLMNIFLVLLILLVGSYARVVNASKIENEKIIYTEYLVSQLQVIVIDEINFKVENYSNEKIEYLVSIKDICNDIVIDSYSDVILEEDSNYYNIEDNIGCFTPVVSIN